MDLSSAKLVFDRHIGSATLSSIAELSHIGPPPQQPCRCSNGIAIPTHRHSPRTQLPHSALAVS